MVSGLIRRYRQTKVHAEGNREDRVGTTDKRHSAIAYATLGAALLVATWFGFYGLTEQIMAKPQPGFAWLATPIDSSGQTGSDPVIKSADLEMRVDAEGRVEDLTGASEVNVEYNIMAPCGNKSTRIALYLAYDARLKDIRTIGGGKPRISDVEGKLPDLGLQRMQLITDTIDDGPLCAVPDVAKESGTVLTVVGRWQHSFFDRTYSRGSVTLPVVGRPWPSNRAVESPPGLTGTWSSPIPSTVKVRVFGLEPTERLDLARPPTENGADLTWKRDDNIRVLAIWTDINNEQRAQTFIFLLGLLGGIGGALVTEGSLPLVAALGRGLVTAGRRLRRRLKRRPGKRPQKAPRSTGKQSGKPGRFPGASRQK